VVEQKPAHRPARRAHAIVQWPPADTRQPEPGTACALFFQRRASLAAVVVLPEPWRPASMMVTGCLPSSRRLRLAAEQFDKLVVNNLDDLLPRRQAGKHFPADRLFRDRGDKILHDLEVDIGLKQRMRTSCMASLIFSSVSLPWPRSFLNTLSSRSVKFSNIQSVTHITDPRPLRGTGTFIIDNWTNFKFLIELRFIVKDESKREQSRTLRAGRITGLLRMNSFHPKGKEN
jgi:hypothetical protein